MKKYITIAALLAAGTSFANALELDDGVKFTTSSFSTENAWTTTESGVSVTLLLKVDAFSALFDSATATARPVFVSVSGSGTNIVGLEAHEGDRIVGASGVVAGGTYDNVYSMAGGDNDSIASIDWNDVVAAALTMSFESSASGTAWALTVLKKDGSYYDQTASNAKLRWSNMGDITKIDIDTDVVSEAYAFDGFVSSTDAYSLNKSVIPEPSAFGMLAGLGAFALVASRRRRR
ncbi:MAG: PEP-CTERM sorting domain-containing protein [Opitutales bacterium]|nr:PEP-CTERM sorting domain-containing protein [Opitutales bacterium]